MQLFKIPPPPENLQCTPTEEAVAARDTLMVLVDAIKAVGTPEENDACSKFGSAMQKLVKDTKRDGLDLRRPYNAAADVIKKMEDDYLAPVIPHMDRLGRLAAVYRQDQERKAEEACRKRAEEIAKLQEQERKAAEDALRAAEAGDLVGSLMADIKTTALGGAVDAAVAAPPPEATKTAGQSFRANDFDFEVTDINALWAARPEFCNPPTAKRAAIKACCGVNSQVPGLRFFPKATVNFTSR